MPFHEFSSARGESLLPAGESFTLQLRTPSRAAAQQRSAALGAVSPSRLAPVEGLALSYPATFTPCLSQ